MRRMHRAGIAAIALAAATIAAGCGSEEQNEYVDEVNALQTELVTEVTETVSSVPPTDPKGFADVAAELQATFDAKADEFEAVDAPDDVAQLHGELVETIRAVGTQIGDAEAGFASGNPRKAQQSALALQEAGTELQTQLNGLIDEINAELGG